MYADGDLLVDGAALNNVPAEVMRARIGSGSVVAVDLFPDVEPVTAAPFDSDAALLERFLAPARAVLARHEWDAEYGAGRALTQQQVVALLLAQD